MSIAEKIKKEKYVIILIIFLAFLINITIIVKVLMPPNGYVFSYDGDLLIQMSSSNSYLWDYKDPYGESNDLILYNPVLGSVYLQSFFGILSKTLNVEIYFTYTIFIILFSILYLYITYKLIGFFIEKETERKITFLLFTLGTGGLGGIFYLLTTNLSILHESTAIHFLSGGVIPTLGFIYYLIPLAAGYASIILFLKRESKNYLLKSSILLGISVLIYPVFFAIISLIIFINSIFYKRVIEFIKLNIIPGIISLAWIIPYIYNNSFYLEYAKKADYINPVVFISHSIFFIIPIAYFLYKKRTKIDKKIQFLVAWTIVIIILTLLPPSITPYQPQRLIHVVWLPLVILGSIALIEFSKRIRIDYKVISASILIISLVSIFIWFSPILSDKQAYITEDYSDALIKLKQYEEGRLLSNPKIGLRSPLLANKRSLLSGVEAFETEEILEDYEKFYSESLSDEDRLNIIKKYNIRYIILGKEELKISMGKINLDNTKFLNIILDGDVKIFEVLIDV